MLEIHDTFVKLWQHLLLEKNLRVVTELIAEPALLMQCSDGIMQA